MGDCRALQEKVNALDEQVEEKAAKLAAQQNAIEEVERDVMMLREDKQKTEQQYHLTYTYAHTGAHIYTSHTAIAYKYDDDLFDQ